MRSRLTDRLLVKVKGAILRYLLSDTMTKVGLDEDDEESMDWWTKYHASVDLMIKVSAVD